MYIKYEATSHPWEKKIIPKSSYLNPLFDGWKIMQDD